MSIEQKIQDFRNELRSADSQALVQRRITHGSCHVLSEDQYFGLKDAVAKEYGLHHSQVVVVGSAKLGFSIAPKKRYRPFTETSDIDVAFASPQLYDNFWRDTFDYWARGGEWENLSDFRRYHFRGWLRPDKLPDTPAFSRSRDWWNFFRSLAGSGKYGSIKITGALYKDWHFLESYQQVCFEQCKNEMET